MASKLDASGLRWPGQVEVMGLRLDLVDGNPSRGQAMGRPVSIELHWTAGGYRTCYNQYHFNVAWDAKNKRACVVRCLKLTQLGAHLWGRNGTSVGVALCAMGPGAPVVREQVIAAGELVGELALHLGLVIGGVVAKPKMSSDATTIFRVSGSITMPVIGDHAMYAQADGYGSDRVDVGSQEANPARNYYQQIKDQAEMVQRAVAKRVMAPKFASFMN